MPAAAFPSDESARLSALHSYRILDTVCDSAFDNIAALAAMLTGTPISAVSLVDAQRQWFKARVGLDITQTPREVSFCAHAVLNPLEPLVVADARIDPRFADNPLVTGEFGLRFYAGIPLVNRDHAALGTLCVIDRQPRTLTPEQYFILQRLAETVMTTLELRRVTAELHQAAYVDFLTGLPNRAALFDALGKAANDHTAHGSGFCLLLLDLDGFKAINDRHGHAAGDAALRGVAKGLTRIIRNNDVVARLGGDEFAVLMHGDDLNAAAAASRFFDDMAELSQSRDWTIAASIGLAYFPEPPANAEDAIKRADAAMYQAKSAGGNRIMFADAAAPTMAEL